MDQNGQSKRRLIDEFMNKPIGQHSAELQRLLWVLRSEPIKGKYALVCTKPFKEWALARLSGQRRKRTKILKQTFASLEDAERAVFRLRWKRHFGGDL